MKNRNHVWIMVLIITLGLRVSSVAQSKITASKKLIVLVKYKTQPEKSNDAIAALDNLIKQVKKEPNFLIIKFHVDPKESTNILLYEEWASETYYTGDHMKTPHLQNFIVSSRNFLAGPPEISQWSLLREY